MAYYHYYVLGPEPDAAVALMKPANEDALISRPVNKAVGNVKSNGPELLEAAR